MGENFCISKHIYLFLPLFNRLSQQTMNIFLHYATAYVIKQITIVSPGNYIDNEGWIVFVI